MNWIATLIIGGFFVLASYSYGTVLRPAASPEAEKTVSIYKNKAAAVLGDVFGIEAEAASQPINIFGEGEKRPVKRHRK